MGLCHFKERELRDALSVRWHHDELVVKIIPTQRRHPGRGVIGEVFRPEVATLLGDKRRQSLGDAALVEALFALGGNELKGICQRRIAQQTAHRRCCGIRQVKVPASLIEIGSLFLEILCQSCRDCESIAGIVNSCCQQVCKVHAAISLMSIYPASHSAGYTDRHRAGSRDTIKPCCGEKLRRCEGSRPATGVERRNLPGLSVVKDPESIAPDTIHMRTHNGQYACHCNYSVRGIATPLQDPKSRLCRQRMASGNCTNPSSDIRSILRGIAGGSRRFSRGNCLWQFGVI